MLGGGGGGAASRGETDARPGGDPPRDRGRPPRPGPCRAASAPLSRASSALQTDRESI